MLTENGDGAETCSGKFIVKYITCKTVHLLVLI
jgi:hypothetical protein